MPPRSKSKAWTFIPADRGNNPLPTQYTGSAFETVPAQVLQSATCTGWFERRGLGTGYRVIAGVDEVGRGALFGPVLAAAVILDFNQSVEGIQDSKRLTPRRREQLAGRIRQQARAYAVAHVDAGEIDRLNIHQASRLAMRNAVRALKLPAELVLVDALRLDLSVPQVSIIRGDAISVSIAAASIVAKVERDRMMVEWDQEYPGYRLARNKGYGTREHLDGLREMGPSPLHRRSYAPVAGCGEAGGRSALLQSE